MTSEVSANAPVEDNHMKESGGEQPRSILRDFTSDPSTYKPFILLILTFVLMQSTGTFAIIFYAVNVFQGL